MHQSSIGGYKSEFEISIVHFEDSKGMLVGVRVSLYGKTLILRCTLIFQMEVFTTLFMTNDY